jgi:hypothetical protein
MYPAHFPSSRSLQPAIQASASAPKPAIEPDAAGAVAAPPLAHGGNSPALDVLLIRGHGDALGDLAAIRERCEGAGLKLEIVQASQLDEVKDGLYRAGKLDSGTQVIIVAKGSIDAGSGRHQLRLADDGSGRDTIDLIASLRTPPADMPSGPRQPAWNGTLHLHSDQAQAVASEQFAQSAEWNRGNFIAYAGNKHASPLQTQALVENTCDAVAAAREQPGLLNPAALVANALRVTGDAIVCGGADFEAPLKIGAPRDEAEAHLQSVVDSLDDAGAGTARISGTSHDKARLLAALRQQDKDDPAPSAEKLCNVMLTRAGRGDFDSIKRLEANHAEARSLALSRYGVPERSHAYRSVQGSAGCENWHLGFIRYAKAGKIEDARDLLWDGIRHSCFPSEGYPATRPGWEQQIAPVACRHPSLLAMALHGAQAHSAPALERAILDYLLQQRQLIPGLLLDSIGCGGSWQDLLPWLAPRFPTEATQLYRKSAGWLTPEGCAALTTAPVHCQWLVVTGKLSSAQAFSDHLKSYYGENSWPGKAALRDMRALVQGNPEIKGVLDQWVNGKLSEGLFGADDI